MITETSVKIQNTVSGTIAKVPAHRAQELLASGQWTRYTEPTAPKPRTRTRRTKQKPQPEE